ncbi:MAG: NYN domain-containing protein [Gemmatimonadota bacterium]
MAERRVVLFVDNQNMYKGARTAFFPLWADYVAGQFDPVGMGELICQRAPSETVYRLEGVRVYTGQPDSTKDPTGYGASRKQQAHWRKRGAEVIARPLRYPFNYPEEKPEEKGIDVQLAIDFVAMAIDHDFDVGVVASTDTDLLPALDFVRRKYPRGRKVEVAAWKADDRRYNPRLSLQGDRIWCHWMERAAFEGIQDATDYVRT